MDSNRSLARRAGLLYLLHAIPAPFAYLYLPRLLLVEGDALATAERVRASEGLLRAAIAAELYSVTLLVLAVLALYRLFKSVDPGISTLMAALMLISVPISCVNVLNHIAPLVLLQNSAIAAALDPVQVAAQVSLFLRLHSFGLVVAQIFWGLWLIPLGILILRSGFIPRWLAFPLFLAGTGYVLNSLGTIVLPQSLRWITDSLLILGVGELPFFTFWLLIWGARGHAVDRLAASLVLTMFAIGAAATVLLLLRRIEPAGYAALRLAWLVLVLGLVMRWRSESAADRLWRTRGAAM